MSSFTTTPRSRTKAFGSGSHTTSRFSSLKSVPSCRELISPRTIASMNALPPLVLERLDAVRVLCEKYGVKSLSIFGSAVKGTFDPETSDLDFVVEFLPETPVGGLRGPYFSLLRELHELFERNVDLVERKAIDNPYFVKVLELTQQSIYERSAAA